MPYRHQCAIRSPRRPEAFTVDVESLNCTEEAFCIGTQWRRLAPEPEAVQELRRGTQVEHIGRVEAGNLVLVGLHALEEVVHRAVIGEAAFCLEPLP